MSRAWGHVCPISQHGLAREQRDGGCGAEECACFMVAEGTGGGQEPGLGGLGLLLLPYPLLSPCRQRSLAQFALAFVDRCHVRGGARLLCKWTALSRMLLLRGQTTWEWARASTHTTWAPATTCRQLWAPLGPRLALALPGLPAARDGITFQTTADVGLMAS